MIFLKFWVALGWVLGGHWAGGGPQKFMECPTQVKILGPQFWDLGLIVVAPLLLLRAGHRGSSPSISAAQVLISIMDLKKSDCRH